MNDVVKPKVTVTQVITALLKLRDTRATLKREYEDEDAAIKAKMDKMLAWANKQMAELETDQLSSNEAGATLYREIDTKFSAADWPLVWQYIRDNDRFDMLQKRLGEGALKEILNETGELPPGINMFQEYKVNLRRK